MFLTLEDEMGLFEVVVFSKAQDRFARIILTSEVLILEGRLKRQGPTGLGLYIRNFGEGSGWPLRAPDETLGLCDENSQN
jgi:DNA polymerase III alpha subunit